jgi:hypothetical protein
MLARTMLYLASGEAAAITGADVLVGAAGGGTG